MIPNPGCPLRYRISDWKQLDGVQSNNSRDLNIRITRFLNDCRLCGTRIEVYHETFGTLFSTLVGVGGTLISSMDSGVVFTLTPAQILEELAKWGFLIEYNPEKRIPGKQLEFLMTLQGLHFDKIRVLSIHELVHGVTQFRHYVVAFKIDPLGDWVNASYSPSKEEFQTAVSEGHAMNVSAISEVNQYSWDWLYGWVGNISDILKDNS